MDHYSDIRECFGVWKQVFSSFLCSKNIPSVEMWENKSKQSLDSLHSSYSSDLLDPLESTAILVGLSVNWNQISDKALECKTNPTKECYEYFFPKE